MKRSMPWSDQEDDSSSDESSSSGDDKVGSDKRKVNNSSVAGGRSGERKAQVKSSKSKSGAIDFEALKRHGYKGGLSVLRVPPPKEDDKNKDWSWSTGEKNDATKNNEEESYEERQKTRAKLADAEQLMHVQTRKDKNISFSQKEKKKRELGQASRGKNYVEEEKRLLRDSGVYSGFDS